MSTNDKGSGNSTSESNGSELGPALAEKSKTLIFPLDSVRMDKLHHIITHRSHYLVSETISELIDEEIQRMG